MMVLSGTFYLFLLFVMRASKISRDPDLGSPHTPKALKCAAAGGQILILAILAIPGVLLLRMHGMATAIVGALSVFAAGGAALLIPHHPLHRRAPKSPGSQTVFILTAVLFWGYLIQLGVATTTRFFPDAFVRGGKVVDARAWKGAGFRENMLPLVGLWYLVDPDAYYTEYVYDGKTVTKRLWAPDDDDDSP